MALTGIATMVGNGNGLEAFGLELVAPGREIAWLATVGGVVHSPPAWLLVLLVIGHAGAALWHGSVRIVLAKHGISAGSALRLAVAALSLDLNLPKDDAQ